MDGDLSGMKCERCGKTTEFMKVGNDGVTGLCDDCSYELVLLELLNNIHLTDQFVADTKARMIRPPTWRDKPPLL